MKKRFSRIIGIAVLLMTVVSLLAIGTIPALAAKGDNPANDNPQNLYLYQKDAVWDIVWGGAWGKYNYSLSGTIITGPFNGHGLVPGTGYTLVEYNGWPSVTVIGSGTADAYGDVHIQGTANVGTPTTWDGDYVGQAAGYKIWLVLSSDVSGGSLTGWNPSAYLFEHNLIP